MIARRSALAAAAFFPLLLAAQNPAAREIPRHLTAGSSDEDYLRYLQIAGLATPYPWSIREFSQPELAKMAVRTGTHPWSKKGLYTDSLGRFSFAFLPVNAVLRYNSAFPYGSNDGAVWQGRGLTSAIDIGFALRAGPLSITVNPIAFSAQNKPFQLQSNGSATNPFADPLFPGNVDRPQRFGNGTYSRLDPGETTVRVDGFGLTAGVSTANMGWGPMENYPYMLGGNAPGFFHGFLGTSTPLPIFIGRLHARAIWGELDQSAYSPVTGTSYYSSVIEPGTKRFATGVVASFLPRGIDGLEIGGGRFFHSFWPKEGIPRSYFTKPFEALFKVGLSGSPGFSPNADPGIADNQLASLFARWAFPKSGFEAYGEYGREDHSYDKRDFVQEPDHERTYGLGLRKVVGVDSAHLTAFRAEMINYEMPTLGRNRGEGGIYVHGSVLQGHTNRGQLLGTDAGVGSGGGSIIAIDRYYGKGMLSIDWTRTIRAQRGTFYLNGVNDPHSNDVANAVGVVRTRFVGRGELMTGLTVVREYNRDFERNAWNLNLDLGFRVGLNAKRPNPPQAARDQNPPAT